MTQALQAVCSKQKNTTKETLLRSRPVCDLRLWTQSLDPVKCRSPLSSSHPETESLFWPSGSRPYLSFQHTELTRLDSTHGFIDPPPPVGSGPAANRVSADRGGVPLVRVPLGPTQSSFRSSEATMFEEMNRIDQWMGELVS